MPIFPSKSLEAINYSINYGIGLDSTALSVKKRELPQHGCRCLEYVTDQEGKAIDSSPLFPLLPASMSLSAFPLATLVFGLLGVSYHCHSHRVAMDRSEKSGGMFHHT